MTIHLDPDVAAGLTALAAAHGLTVEDYLKELVETELPVAMPEPRSSDAGGMVWEDGLFIYGAGTALPRGFISDAIRRSREDRSQHLLGSRT